MNQITAAEYRDADTLDQEVRKVSDLSALGQLADDVLFDIIEADDDPRAISRSSALKVASAWFRSAGASFDPAEQFWPPTDFSSALRRMLVEDGKEVKELSGARPGRSAAWLDVLVEQIDRLLLVQATPEETEQVRAAFDRLSRLTLEAAQDAAEKKPSAISWLTT